MQIRPLVSFFAGCVVLSVVAQGQTLRKAAAFDLPGPGGKRFDYLTIDEDDRYLISAHLAADQTYVIDLATNKVVATIADTPGAEGVEYVPELKKFYTSNAHDNTIGVVDLKQLKVIKKLKTESKPDGSAYAAPFHKLYVSDERGKAEAGRRCDQRRDCEHTAFQQRDRNAARRSSSAQSLCEFAGPEHFRSH